MHVTLLILTLALRERHYHPHFPDEKLKASGKKSNAEGHTGREANAPELEPGSADPKPILLTLHSAASWEHT